MAQVAGLQGTLWCSQQGQVQLLVWEGQTGHMFLLGPKVPLGRARTWAVSPHGCVYARQKSSMTRRGRLSTGTHQPPRRGVTWAAQRINPRGPVGGQDPPSVDQVAPATPQMPSSLVLGETGSNSTCHGAWHERKFREQPLGGGQDQSLASASFTVMAAATPQLCCSAQST